MHFFLRPLTVGYNFVEFSHCRVSDNRAEELGLNRSYLGFHVEKIIVKGFPAMIQDCLSGWKSCEVSIGQITVLKNAAE